MTAPAAAVPSLIRIATWSAVSEGLSGATAEGVERPLANLTTFDREPAHLAGIPYGGASPP